MNDRNRNSTEKEVCSHARETKILPRIQTQNPNHQQKMRQRRQTGSCERFTHTETSL